MKMIALAVAALFCLASKAQDASTPEIKIAETEKTVTSKQLDTSKPVGKLVFPVNIPDNTPPALVDLDAYETLIKQVKEHRKKRLIGLDSFMALSKKPNVIILDTRSDSMYNAKHIKGAIHLNFSDFTQYSLRALIPNSRVTILIYCNNNINEAVLPSTAPRYFVTKTVVPSIAPPGTTPVTLALNIPTYINLFGYGYRNVFELNEFVAVNDPRIEFEGSAVKSKPQNGITGQ